MYLDALQKCVWWVLGRLGGVLVDLLAESSDSLGMVLVGVGTVEPSKSGKTLKFKKTGHPKNSATPPKVIKKQYKII